MLQGLLPALLPAHIEVCFVVFEGKQDLEKRLPKRLRAWRHPDARFVVLRDQDSGECVAVKAALVALCRAAGKPEVQVRIACHELESFYLGDLQAVAEALGPDNLGQHQGKAKYRQPDRLANAAEELKKLAPAYQKVSGSRAIGPRLRIERNRSHSFQVLVRGIQTLAGVAA